MLCEGGVEHTLCSLANSLKCLLLMMCVIIFTKVLFDHMSNYTMKGMQRIFKTNRTIGIDKASPYYINA